MEQPCQDWVCLIQECRGLRHGEFCPEFVMETCVMGSEGWQVCCLGERSSGEEEMPECGGSGVFGEREEKLSEGL